MKNKYKINGDVTTIYVYDSQGIQHEALIDTEDLELVKWVSNWSLVRTGQGEVGYISGSLNGDNILLHRLVMKALTMFNKEIDHIKHNTLDNRKSQLRIVTKAENQQNKRLSKDNLTGITGVHFDPENKKWIAKIGINGKRKYLGSFDNKEDAIEAREEGEKKYHKYKQSLQKNN